MKTLTALLVLPVLLLIVACSGQAGETPIPTPTPAGEDRPGGIEGAVTGPDDGPVVGMRVAIVSGTAPYPEIAPETDEQGHYRLYGITPGTYEVAVLDRQGQRVGLESVVVESGETVTLVFSVSVGAASVDGGQLPPLPVIRLRHDGKTYEGAQGSYCWPDAVADDGSIVALCADKFSWDAFDGALSVSTGDSVTIGIDAQEPPRQLSVAFYELNDGPQVMLAEPVPGLETAVEVDLPVGVYNVRVFGLWADGDVAYEFRIQVDGRETAASAKPTGGLCLPATPLAVSVGETWTLSGPVHIPEGFPGELPDGAAELSIVFEVGAVETKTYMKDRGATPIEHPGVQAQLTTLVLDDNGNTLSAQEESGSWTPASVVNLGPVLTLERHPQKVCKQSGGVPSL